MSLLLIAAWNSDVFVVDTCPYDTFRDIAKNLQLTTIAEFVEDAGTAHILCDLETDGVQGRFWVPCSGKTIVVQIGQFSKLRKYSH